MYQQNVKILANILVHFYPKAYAILNGSPKYPEIEGGVFFYQIGKEQRKRQEEGDFPEGGAEWEAFLEEGKEGVFIVTEITGLPFGEGECSQPFLGFHIHEETACTGTEEDPFRNSGGHFNPHGCPHPSHAGDMPPLLNNKGTACSIVLSSQFTVDEIIGRTLIVHSMADDFTTQPAGGSGEKIACGKIRRYPGSL